MIFLGAMRQGQHEVQEPVLLAGLHDGVVRAVHRLPEVGALLQHLLLGLPTSGVAVPATATWRCE